MATKSRKFEQAEWFKLFSAKKMRIIAFVLACVIAGGFCLSLVLYANSHADSSSKSYLKSESYKLASNEMYEELCVTASAYLRYVDEDRNYTQSRHLLNDYLNYLDYNRYKYKKTESGIQLIDSQFDYYVGITQNGETRYLSNIKDIEKYSSYDPYTYNSIYSKYGGTRKYTSGTFVKGEGITGGVEDESDARLVKASSSNPVTVTQTYYNYSNPYNYFENKLAYNVLFSGRDYYFWLASRCVDLASSICGFGVRFADSSNVNGSNLFNSYGGARADGNGVVPVVSLESDISVDGKDTSGAWKLKIE